MCGICGIYQFDTQRPADKETLARMTAAIEHRGPDDQGTHFSGNVGLGFRRLSIVDLSLGHQPMANEDDSVWIVFNGEIYNHEPIRQYLIGRGHHYKTGADTETIVHLFEEEGLAGIPKLNGMFAFALWDSRRKELHIARDRLGVKPLYYFRSSTELVFASEIKSLLQHPNCPREVRSEGIEEYFTFRFVAGEETLFRGIHVLLPGHTLTVRGNTVSTSQYWDLLSAAEFGFREHHPLDALDDLLSDSVKLRLMSDVPLGSLNSGGVDSSLTTALAMKHSSGGMNTYSVGFAEEEFDERRYAKLVAEHVHSQHHELLLTPEAFAESLVRAAWHNDEPLNHANSIPIYLISKFAREKVTVLLTGEGADEAFLGYPRYLIPEKLRFLGPLAPIFGAGLSALNRISPSDRFSKLSRAAFQSSRERLVLNSAFLSRKEARSICSPSVPSSLLEYRFAELDRVSAQLPDTMSRLSYVELKTYLVSILNRMDKMTMAARVEGREPCLDYRLIEWAFTLPLSQKIHGITTKYLIKKLGERYLPREVVYRPKSGFGIPIGKWLRDPGTLGKFRDYLNYPEMDIRDYIDRNTLEQALNQHNSGSADRSDLLWEVLSLELWHRLFISRRLSA